MNDDTTLPEGATALSDSRPAGERNRYFRHKEMRVRDFDIEQRYGIGRRRLLTRAIAGWGVAFGFELGFEEKADSTTRQLSCGKGLAIDQRGRELHRSASGPLVCKDIVLDDNLKATKPSTPVTCLLQAHYCERKTDPLRTSGSCDCGEEEWNHVCEDVIFSLKLLGDQTCPSSEDFCIACECPTREPFSEPNVSADGGGGADGVDGANAANAAGAADPPIVANVADPAIPANAAEAKDAVQNVSDSMSTNTSTAGGLNLHPSNPTYANDHDRGPHSRLCEWQTGKAGKIIPADDGKPPSCLAGCVSWEDGVALACVKVHFDACNHPVFDEIVDACTPRRLLKTNDLLFDLIRGCDLTRILHVSWLDEAARSPANNNVPLAEQAAEAGREPDMPEFAWETVRERFGQPKPGKTPVTTRFTVTFSAPVQVATLTARSVKMTCYFTSHCHRWITARGVPIVGWDCDAPYECKADPKDKSRDPDTTTRCARIVVDEKWWEINISGKSSELSCAETTVDIEIEIRGDFILDSRGQAVDANPVGPRMVPSGNGTPGGTHVSMFRIKR
jgi:hypothetical protein